MPENPTYVININLPGQPGDTTLESRLAGIEASINALRAQEEMFMSDLSARITTLQQEVAEQTSVNASAVTLLTTIASDLQGVRDDLAARGVTDEQLASFDAQIAAVSDNTDALAEAVAANTEADPADPDPV